MKIPFNTPFIIGNELEYITNAIKNRQLSGDGQFTKKCHEWLEKKYGCCKALLTHSCTAALEMAAILIDIQPGDEIIMPSYTFVSTANAFVLRGGVPVFVDIRPDTMNIDETKIEAAITRKTKAIVPVHYAGVACEMDTIMEIAEQYQLIVVEDAAQAILAEYKGKKLGTIGHFGTLSFHETKNVISGEGGALLINIPEYCERAEIIREKGTNRSCFFRGQVDKYTWVDIGSSYLPGEIIAAFLYGQLEWTETIIKNRKDIWGKYYSHLQFLIKENEFEIPVIPKECHHNGHLFYVKLKNLESRTRYIEYFKKELVASVFHYVPLHSSPAGMKFGRFNGIDRYTTLESDRLLRLPLYHGMSDENSLYVIDLLKKMYECS